MGLARYDLSNDLASHVRFVRHDRVHAEFRQTFHLAGVVDGPNIERVAFVARPRGVSRRDHRRVGVQRVWAR